jgi:hypothetical protein
MGSNSSKDLTLSISASGFIGRGTKLISTWLICCREVLWSPEDVDD